MYNYTLIKWTGTNRLPPFRNLYGNLGMFHGRGMGQMKILNGKWLVE